MTRNVDANATSDLGPCEGCINRRTCADRARPQACVAFEKFDNDEPRREWRDAPREPSPVIGRRLLVKWWGTETTEKYMRENGKPSSSDEIAYGLAATANKGNRAQLAKLARSMQRENYRAADIARIMKLPEAEVAQLLALAAIG